MISIIIPVYNEEKTLYKLYSRLSHIINKCEENFEIIFINDGSEDSSLKILENINQQDKRYKVIDLSRNFGHQVAITAGIKYATGDAIILMDADLQDPPEVINELIKEWKKGFDVVYAVRKTRKGEKVFKLFTASLFYKLLNKLSPIDIPKNTGDFRLISRRVANQLNKINERSRFIRGLCSWIGYKQTKIYYVRDKRYAGKTKYTLMKMIRFAFDGLTSFSHIPLQIATYLGFLVSFSSFVYILFIFYSKYILKNTVPGWSSLMVAILFLGGVQLMSIGLIGEYIGRIFEEVKKRPLYVINKKIGF